MCKMSNFAENSNAMKTKQELLKHCRYYHEGDEWCPDSVADSKLRAYFFWKGEWLWVTSNGEVDEEIGSLVAYGLSDEQMEADEKTRIFTSIPIGLRACLFAVFGCGTDCSGDEVAKYFTERLEEYLD